MALTVSMLEALLAKKFSWVIENRLVMPFNSAKREKKRRENAHWSEMFTTKKDEHNNKCNCKMAVEVTRDHQDAT